MGELKCPRCGSKDCKEREITLDNMIDVAVEFGIEAIKGLFSGRMDYQSALNNSSEKVNPNNKEKRYYRCRACRYTWEKKR